MLAEPEEPVSGNALATLEALQQSNFTIRRNTVLTHASALRQGFLRILAAPHEPPLTPELRLRLQDLADDAASIECKPFTIGVTGCVSSGKSSFLNTLFGAHILASDEGSTTAVPTHISYAPGENLVATVEFFNTEEVSEVIRQYVLTSSREGDRESPSHDGFETTLSHFFDFGERFNGPHPNDVGAELIPLPGGLLEFVGRAPLEVYRGIDYAELSRVLRRYTTRTVIEGNVSMASVIKRVDISLPFCLPPGVVVVDTPGLGDAITVNSQRTIDSIRDFSEVWHCTQSTKMASEDERKLLDEVCLLQEKDLRIVATCADAFPFGEGHIRRNLQAFFLSVVEDISFGKAQRRIESGGDISPEILCIAEEVPINPTGNASPGQPIPGPPVGFDPFHDYLLDVGRRAAAKLGSAEKSLKHLRRRVRNMGICPTIPLPPESIGFLENWQRSFKRQLREVSTALERAGDRNRIPGSYAKVSLAGDWNRLHGNTIRAAMDPCRKGQFISTGKVRKYIDVNREIAMHWRNDLRFKSQRLRAILSEACSVFDNLDQNYGAPDMIDLTGMIRQKLQIKFDDVISNVFVGDISRDIQSHLRRTGVFRWERTTMPTEREFRSVLECLCQNAHAGVAILGRALDRAFERILQLSVPVDRLPKEVRSMLDQLLEDAKGISIACQFDEVFVSPEDCKCPICLDWFDKPVETICGHVFCKKCIHAWVRRQSSCPMCCQSLSKADAAMTRHDVVRSVNHWKQQERLGLPVSLHGHDVGGEEPLEATGDGMWYAAAWRRYREEFLSPPPPPTHAAHEGEVHDEEEPPPVL